MARGFYRRRRRVFKPRRAFRRSQRSGRTMRRGRYARASSMTRQRRRRSFRTSVRSRRKRTVSKRRGLKKALLKLGVVTPNHEFYIRQDSTRRTSVSNDQNVWFGPILNSMADLVALKGLTTVTALTKLTVHQARQTITLQNQLVSAVQVVAYKFK